MSERPDTLKAALERFRQAPWPEENQIIAHWLEPMAEPLVSVFCASFNHKEWIADAIKGFLLQQTPFRFEVIIHDDASTDGSNEVIRSIAERYPRLIKPILQTTNQFSQGNRPAKAMLPASSGSYIALCEGDDYWIDAQKLARQAKRMQSQPELSFITHNAISQKGERAKLFRRMDKEMPFEAQDIIDCDRQFAPTASYMFKRELYEVLPSWFSQAPVGDFYLELYSQKLGTGLYLPDCMSVYRQNLPGSWSAGFNADRAKKLKFLRANLPCLALLHQDFPQLSRAIDAKIIRTRWKLLDQLVHYGDKQLLADTLSTEPVPGQALHQRALKYAGMAGLRTSLWLARKLAG